MANCKNCVKCEGLKISSNCIVWEGITTEFESFNELIEFVLAKARLESKLDLKTLSSDSDNSYETAIQLLIDKEVQRVHAATSTSSSSSSNATCNLNVSLLDGCSNCSKSFCEKLELMVSEIALLKAEVNQLKSQI